MRARRIAVRALAVLVMVLLVEAICYRAGSWIADRDRFIRYRPQRVATISYDEYVASRDDLLGWPGEEALAGPAFDGSGSRPNPSFPDPTVPSCISLYGDSFTQGAEVDDRRAWGNLLSKLVGCRVANFAVGGYGTDQAYLRFKRIESPSPVVGLGYLSSNIVRNVSRLKDLQSEKIEYVFKPRFVLNRGGELRLVPMPHLTEEEYLRVMGVLEPDLVLEHESFQPGGPLAVEELRFPFTISILRAAPGLVRRAAAHRPHYADLYEPGHPTQGLEVTAEIMKAFWRDARAAGKEPFIVIFTTVEELAYQRRAGQFSYENLLKILDDNQMNYLDLGPVLVRHLGSRNVIEIFEPGGHYDEETNELVAESVYRHLRDRGIVPHPLEGDSDRTAGLP